MCNGTHVVGLGLSIALHAAALAWVLSSPSATVTGPRLRGEGPVMEGYIVPDDDPSLLPRESAEPAPSSPLTSPVPAHHKSSRSLTARVVARESISQSSSLDESRLVEQPAADLATDYEAKVFQKALFQHIERYQHYPEAARQDGITGVVQVSFTMDRDGTIVSVWILERSGYSVLDEEALATVWRAQPLPPIPSHLPGRMQIVLPIAFHVS